MSKKYSILLRFSYSAYFVSSSVEFVLKEKVVILFYYLIKTSFMFNIYQRILYTFRFERVATMQKVSDPAMLNSFVVSLEMEKPDKEVNEM